MVSGRTHQTTSKRIAGTRYSFYQTQTDAGATLIIDQYTQLNNERQSLLSDNYPLQHPQVVSLDNQLIELGKDIDNTLRQYSNQLNSSISNLRREIRNNNQILRNLPSEDIEF